MRLFNITALTSSITKLMFLIPCVYYTHALTIRSHVVIWYKDFPWIHSDKLTECWSNSLINISRIKIISAIDFNNNGITLVKTLDRQNNILYEKFMTNLLNVWLVSLVSDTSHVGFHLYSLYMYRSVSWNMINLFLSPVKAFVRVLCQ